MEPELIKLLACEEKLIVLRDWNESGLVYVRESWLKLGSRTSLNKYGGFAGSEIIAWMKPSFEALKLLDPQQRRVRIFWLWHSFDPQTYLDGHGPFRADVYGGRQVGFNLSPGRPAVAPVGAHAVTASQRVVALRNATEMRDYWLRWQRGQTPASAPPESKPVQESPKSGFLAWMFKKGKR